jgi:hypothetical protein
MLLVTAGLEVGAAERFGERRRNVGADGTTNQTSVSTDVFDDRCRAR